MLYTPSTLPTQPMEFELIATIREQMLEHSIDVQSGEIGSHFRAHKQFVLYATSNHFGHFMIHTCTLICLHKIIFIHGICEGHHYLTTKRGSSMKLSILGQIIKILCAAILTLSKFGLTLDNNFARP